LIRYVYHIVGNLTMKTDTREVEANYVQDNISGYAKKLDHLK